MQVGCNSSGTHNPTMRLARDMFRQWVLRRREPSLEAFLLTSIACTARLPRLTFDSLPPAWSF